MAQASVFDTNDAQSPHLKGGDVTLADHRPMRQGTFIRTVDYTTRDRHYTVTVIHGGTLVLEDTMKDGEVQNWQTRWWDASDPDQEITGKDRDALEAAWQEQHGDEERD